MADLDTSAPDVLLMADLDASAPDVLRCDLCETVMVQMYCNTCLVNLCEACAGEHAFSDKSKKHEILRFRKSTPLYPGCTSHDNKQCELYCNQCIVPACDICAVSEHLGHELAKVLEVLDKKKEMIINEKKELSETIFPVYQSIASEVQNRMSQLEKESEDLSTAIAKQGEDLHTEIDKLVKKMKDEVEEMKTTQLHTLQKHLDEVNKKISDINDEIRSADAALDSNDIITVLNAVPNVHEYKELPQTMRPSSPKFTPGRIQHEELSKLLGILSSVSVPSEEQGYSMKTTQKSPEAASSPVIKQLLDDPQTVITIHTRHRKSHAVASLSEEEIWTCGSGNTMRLYSNSLGSQLDSISTKSRNAPGPSDIAVTSNGDLLYCDYVAGTVNIVKDREIQTVIKLQNWKPEGICPTSSGDLLVTMDNKDDKLAKVVCYSGSKKTQTIQFDDQGRPLYSSAGYISENRNLDICVADCGARAVVVVNQAGKLRFRYTGHTPAPKNKSFYPRGIATDSQSHILTADRYNDCVHITDQNGQFLRYIACGLSDPEGLCTDTNDYLFVVQYFNKQVKKIKYLQSNPTPVVDLAKENHEQSCQPPS